MAGWSATPETNLHTPGMPQILPKIIQSRNIDGIYPNSTKARLSQSIDFNATSATSMSKVAM